MKESTKRKISRTMKAKGIKPPSRKGQKISDEHKKKIGLATKKRLNSESTKKRIILWAEKHGRLPNRKSNKDVEKRYGTRMENYLSPLSGSFDAAFRELIYSKFPRKINNKRTHDKKLRMKEILMFVQENNRVPSDKVGEERKLTASLWNYTNPNSPTYNKTLESKILKIDKCYRTGIAKKYRQCINNALEEVESKLKIEKIFS